MKQKGEKYKRGTMAEALRSEDTGCGVEDYRHGVIGDGAQTWHWRLHGYKHLSNSQLKIGRAHV